MSIIASRAVDSQHVLVTVPATTTVSTSRAFSTAFKIVADTELVPNKLFAAVNLSYEPGVDKARGDLDWTQSATYGVTGALAYRVTPRITLGGEVEYYRAYDSFGFNNFQGHAVYVGPTLHIQFSPKTLLSAAFSTQVAGRAVGETHALDLTNFERYHANLKVEFEF